MSRRPLRILVTGGGTGGHVGPALAVIQTIQGRALSPAPEFLYVGSAAGVEARLATEAGILFAPVATGKLRRSRRGPIGLLTLANLRDAGRVPVGVGQAFAVVRHFRPDVVLATGGYVSVPPVIAARLLRVPVLTHEQTVTVGLANRIAGRFATRIALSFETSLPDLPADLRARAFVTGNPVRQAILGGDPARARARFGLLSDLPTVYITGGAQGSRVINEAVLAALPDLLTRYQIIHQCGEQPAGTPQDFDRLTSARAALPPALQARYFVTRFVQANEIGDAYRLADLIVGRSGAGTVTEACALGKPALFIPLVPASGDEQTKNAHRSEEAGAAALLLQSNCNAPHLVAALTALLDHPARLSDMGRAALSLARPRAADDLADALLALAR